MCTIMQLRPIHSCIFILPAYNIKRRLFVIYEMQSHNETNVRIILLRLSRGTYTPDKVIITS